MSAVTIDCPIDEGVTLASVMKMVVRTVDLKKIGVMVHNTRQTRTGGILLEVDSPEGANTLAEKVRQAIAGKMKSDPSRISDPYPPPWRAQLSRQGGREGRAGHLWRHLQELAKDVAEGEVRGLWIGDRA